MGVRLVMFDKAFAAVNGTNVPDLNDHNLLTNRDMKNQHPIYAISGLQDVLNNLEDLIRDTNVLVLQIQQWCYDNIGKLQKEFKDLKDYVDSLPWIEDTLNTDSVTLTYDKKNHTLKADVNIYPDDNNSIQSLYGGLFVPKVLTENTNTVMWHAESSGESLEDIFNHGERFSHRSNSWSDHSLTAEENTWYWDASRQSFVQPMNTDSYNGFITMEKYDRYVHTVTITSTDGDDDMNGIVVGHTIDGSGNPHTLTACVSKRGVLNGNTWALVYDYALPDEKILFTRGNCTGGTVPGNNLHQSWSSDEITVTVTKEDNIVKIACSDWNSNTINEYTEITIDLNDYSWGNLFLGKVKYGYSNHSQANSYFKDVYFKSREISEYNTFKAYVRISEEPGNGIKEKNDGIWSEEFKASKEADNILQKKDDGWYVKNPLNVVVSPKQGNQIQQLTDGLYVPPQDFINRREAIQTNHGFSIGDFVYYHPDGSYKLAKGIDDYDANIVGMVVEVKDANTFSYQWSGFFQTDLFNKVNGFVQGMPVYISDEFPGKTTQQQPDISKAVGYPVENIGIIISIERGIQYNQEASVGDFKVSANNYNVRSDGYIRIIEDVDYKMSMIVKLTEALTDDFKNRYMSYDSENGLMTWKNVSELYSQQDVSAGMNLFIKAF